MEYIPYVIHLGAWRRPGCKLWLKIPPVPANKRVDHPSGVLNRGCGHSLLAVHVLIANNIESSEIVEPKMEQYWLLRGGVAVAVAVVDFVLGIQHGRNDLYGTILHRQLIKNRGSWVFQLTDSIFNDSRGCLDNTVKCTRAHLQTHHPKAMPLGSGKSDSQSANVALGSDNF